ncbi:hypothetical protein LINPERHAP2_LOCUS35025 [Linum perenne]
MSFYRPWSKALVVRVLEKSFAYPLIKRRLEFLWAKAGRIQVSDLSNDFFLVRFSDVDDYHRAAFNGPWKMFEYYITVACWTPEFNEEAPIQRILTWVRLPKLPIHFFNHTAVTRIGNHIGRTIRLDLATSEGARARYARVCVEVDLTKPLLGKYMIGDRVFYVEYECLENICFTCGMYGHKMGSCPLSIDPQPASAPAEVTLPTDVVKEPEADSGSWMTVRRRSKGTANKQRPSATSAKTETSASEANKGSRFTILKPDKAANTHQHSLDIRAPQQAAPPAKNQAANSIHSMIDLANQIFPKDGDKDGGSTTFPLGDITNRDLPSGKSQSGKSKLPTQHAETLFSVPISYEDAIFEGAKQILGAGPTPRGTKDKGKASRTNRSKTEATTSSKDKPKVKSFAPRLLQRKSQTIASSQQIVGNGGRPPDVVAQQL